MREEGGASAKAILAANRNDCPVGRIYTTEPEDALITRPDFNVVIRHLPPGGAVFLSQLMSGDPLGRAASFDLSANIAGLLEAPSLPHSREIEPDDR